MTADDYILLITSQHADKPLFVETVRTLTDAVAQTGNAVAALSDNFDLSQAVGVQLDAIGLWVGIGRRLNVELTGVYFAWDSTDLVGWDSGTWKGEFDPDTGISVLPDDAYRQIILAKIAANSWDGTIADAERVWNIVFADTGQNIVVQDNQDMSMAINFTGPSLTAIQIALLTSGFFPLKPEGVRIAFYNYPPTVGTLFAWDSDSVTLQGWDIGRWAVEI
jgi:hypothetical protein